MTNQTTTEFFSLATSQTTAPLASQGVQLLVARLLTDMARKAESKRKQGAGQ